MLGPKLKRSRSPGTTRYSGTRLQSIPVVSGAAANTGTTAPISDTTRTIWRNKREIKSAPERIEARTPHGEGRASRVARSGSADSPDAELGGLISHPLEGVKMRSDPSE